MLRSGSWAKDFLTAAWGVFPPPRNYYSTGSSWNEQNAFTYLLSGQTACRDCIFFCSPNKTDFSCCAFHGEWSRKVSLLRHSAMAQEGWRTINYTNVSLLYTFPFGGVHSNAFLRARYARMKSVAQVLAPQSPLPRSGYVVA